MLLVKKRINSLSCFKYLMGKIVVLGLHDAERFKKVLWELGFSEILEKGERVLPAVLNHALAKNAEPFFQVDKNKPKEHFTQTLLWTRHEWAGRGETREVTDYVYIPRERYARIWFEPYGVELSLDYNAKGGLELKTDPIVYSYENEQLLLNTINIFLNCFGECDVIADGLEDQIPSVVKRLNWVILPKGKNPWNHIEGVIKRVTAKESKTVSQLMLDRSRFINGFAPDFWAYGRAGFSGYVVFGFSRKQIYVLESMYSNNATYVFENDWEHLSQLSKAEVLNGKLQKMRIIHNGEWKNRISNLLADNNTDKDMTPNKR